MKIKCYACDSVFDEKRLIYTKDPDELMCPVCGEREPGFSEVKTYPSELARIVAEHDAADELMRKAEEERIDE